MVQGGLIGDTLGWQYYFLGGPLLSFNSGSFVVNGGIGATLQTVPDQYQSVTLDVLYIIVDATSITFDYAPSFYTGTWNDSQLSLAPTIYNGIAIDLLAGGTFQSVAIDPATNMVGFNLSDVSFTSNQLQIDWHNLSFDRSTIVKLDIVAMPINHAPVATPDVVVTQKGVPINVDAAGGVLMNDSDPDIHDVLQVSAVNGSGLNVGHALVGAYGTLKLNADGSFIYSPNKNIPIGQGQGQVHDHFIYTIDDGHGGSATSSLDVAILSQQALQNGTTLTTPVMGNSGGSILNDAMGHLGEMWGERNCTGFAFTVSVEASSKFYDMTMGSLQETGAWGSKGLAMGQLLNNSGSPDPNEHLFVVPISDVSNGVAIAHLDSAPSDNWNLVGDSGNQRTTTANFTDFEPGDIFRGVVNGHVGRTDAIAHEGIVSGYDPKTNQLYLIDNFTDALDNFKDDVWNTNVGNRGPKIDYTVISLNPTATTGIHLMNGISAVDEAANSIAPTGPVFAIYRFDGNDPNRSVNDTIVSTQYNDYLSGGSGADTFVFHANFGKDTIFDFSSMQHDVIQIDHTLFKDFAAIHWAVVGNDTIITYDANDTIKLAGVTSLHASDFHFI